MEGTRKKVRGAEEQGGESPSKRCTTLVGEKKKALMVIAKKDNTLVSVFMMKCLSSARFTTNSNS